MKKELQRTRLEEILEAEQISELSFKELTALFQRDTQIAAFRPQARFQSDPRCGEIIVYSTARNQRPHDRPATVEAPANGKECVICAGQTTGIVDVTDLSDGFTFINKNLYPILFPDPDLNPDPALDMTDPAQLCLSGPAWGLHLLQWTSSIHEHDWHNIPEKDALIVMQRLAALEGYLLHSQADHMPANTAWEDPAESFGFVSIIKNSGRSVGGSLEHGHQQITYSSFPPGRIRANWQFEQQHGRSFSAFMQQENPPELLISDFGEALLVVPYFMRRPYNTLLLMRDTSKRYLHELSPAEILAVTRGWQQATRMYHHLMPRLGKPTAFNILTHNGPGAGLYFEFLPFTQAYGGFERLGFSICQQSPDQAAEILREL